VEDVLRQYSIMLYALANASPVELIIAVFD